MRGVHVQQEWHLMQGTRLAGNSGTSLRPHRRFPPTRIDITRHPARTAHAARAPPTPHSTSVPLEGRVKVPPHTRLSLCKGGLSTLLAEVNLRPGRHLNHSPGWGPE